MLCICCCHVKVCVSIAKRMDVLFIVVFNSIGTMHTHLRWNAFAMIWKRIGRHTTLTARCVDVCAQMWKSQQACAAFEIFAWGKSTISTFKPVFMLQSCPNDNVYIKTHEFIWGKCTGFSCECARICSHAKTQMEHPNGRYKFDLLSKSNLSKTMNWCIFFGSTKSWMFWLMKMFCCFSGFHCSLRFSVNLPTIKYLLIAVINI